MAELWAALCPLLHFYGSFLLVFAFLGVLRTGVRIAALMALGVGLVKEFVVDALLRGHLVGADDLGADAAGVAAALALLSWLDRRRG